MATAEEKRNAARGKAGAAEIKANAAKTAAANAAAVRNAARAKAGVQEATANAAKRKSAQQAAIDKAKKDLLTAEDTGDDLSDDVISPDNGAAPDWWIQYQNAEAARERQQRVSSFTLLKTLAEEYGLPSTIADKLIDLVAKQGYTDEAVALELQQTDEFKQRFSGIELYKKNFATEIGSGLKAAPPKPSDYIKMEKAYQEVLNRYGLADMANRTTYSELIGGDVSVAEMTDRVVNVYDKINNADSVLMQQLTSFFPTFGTTDFAKALLTGNSPKDMATQLQRKLAAAEISSEASRAGLQTNAEVAMQLQAMGVSRGLARTGYSKIAEQQTVLNKLGGIYNQDVTGLQTELEAEQFQGLASQRRKKLTEQEKSSFSGRAGTSQSSLNGGTKGMF
jgi:hypothetical protein